jgi:cell division transport system permease protein
MSGALDRFAGSRDARVLPRDAGAVSLDLVIAVMAFLAGIALGGVLVAERAVESWQAGLTGRLTVQILPQGQSVPDSEVSAAVALLQDTPGVAYARALSDADNLKLVEPWLGSDAIVAALPFPKLIDVGLRPGADVDVPTLEARLKRASPRAIMDDHGRWIERLRSAAGTVVFSASAVLALIAIATAATVAFATRAGLAAHREIVQLLHLMGAQDGFIASAFERHYALAAFVASLLGAALAGLLFFTANGLGRFGLVSFLPPLGIPLADLAWLLAVPLGATLIAWATARLSVLAALREFY